MAGVPEIMRSKKAPREVWETNPDYPGRAVARGKDFFVSYADIQANPVAMALSSIFSGGASQAHEETALIGKGGKYYILNGDFRDEYAPLVPKGWKACLAFFRSREPAFGSSWTRG